MSKRLGEVASLAALGVAIVACSSPTVSSIPDRLEGQFILLERLGVDLYWNEEGCHLFAYARGVFRRVQDDADSCWVGGIGSGTPMDSQAERDYRAVSDAFAAGGVRVEYAKMERDASGQVGPGSFFVRDACSTYDFEGDGGFEQEDGALETITPLGDGWYLVSSC